MTRSVAFQVGYDHRAFPEACGGGGHGQHGMTMRWVLQGPHGAVQWLLNMPNWVPGNVAILGDIKGVEPISVVPVGAHGYDGMAVDLGFHSPTSMGDRGEHESHECDVLPGKTCFYDGSSLNAIPILEAFLAHGPHAVWAVLGDYYAETFR